MQTQKWFRPLGAQIGHGAPQLDDATLVAAFAEHLVDAGGAQAGIQVQGLADERQVGIGEAGAQGLRAVEAVGLNGGADGVGMDAKLLGNGANLPMFGVKPNDGFVRGFLSESSKFRILTAGILGNGSTNRPRRPQPIQRRKGG